MHSLHHQSAIPYSLFPFPEGTPPPPLFLFFFSTVFLPINSRHTSTSLRLTAKRPHATLCNQSVGGQALSQKPASRAIHRNPVAANEFNGCDTVQHSPQHSFSAVIL